MPYCIVFSLLLQPSKNAVQELADLYLSFPQLCLSGNVDERGKKFVQLIYQWCELSCGLLGRTGWFSRTEKIELFLRKSLELDVF